MDYLVSGYWGNTGSGICEMPSADCDGQVRNLLNVQHRGRRIGVECVDAVEAHESLSAGDVITAYGGAITRARRNACRIVAVREHWA